MNNNKIFAAIWVFVFAIIAAQPVGINFIVDVQEIPDPENPDWYIRAQCWNNGDGSFKIIFAPESVNDPQFNRIFVHEVGHVNHWDDWGEEECDNFANSVIHDGSEPIHDATY